MLELFQTLTLS